MTQHQQDMNEIVSRAKRVITPYHQFHFCSS